MRPLHPDGEENRGSVGRSNRVSPRPLSLLPAARPQRRRKGRRASCAFVDRRKFLHERHYPPQPCQNRPAPDRENPLPSATHWRPDNRYRENPAGWKSCRRPALPPPWQKEFPPCSAGQTRTSAQAPDYLQCADAVPPWRSEEHTSELQSLMRSSYAVFCLKKKK